MTASAGGRSSPGFTRWGAGRRPSDCPPGGARRNGRSSSSTGTWSSTPGHFYDFEGGPHLVLSLIVEPDVFARGLERLETLL